MRKRSKPNVDHSWLDQFETEGPFLSLPVVKSVWPNGIDRLGDTDDRAVTFKQVYADWLRAYDARTQDNRDEYAEITRAWIDTVLDQLADWDDLHIRWASPRTRSSVEPVETSEQTPSVELVETPPPDLEIHSPRDEIRIRPHGALQGRDTDYAALVRIVEPSDDLRGPGLDGWSATEIDRMAALLRKADVEIGIVTDGRWWGIVWAHRDKPTGSAITDATTWGEEPLVRDAYLTLVNQRRYRAKDTDERLPRLLERSELEAEAITEALGTQVRKAVELLVGSFSRHRLEALAAGDPDPLPEKDDDAYQAAVTVMMRVVFLLFAEERGMLPTEQLYWDSYAIRDVLEDLQKRAAHGEELLDETYDTWHRLLAVSDALHGGVNYDEMRMPAYGGSLLDPNRFPWLSATDDKGLRIKVRDRVMLHVLRSVQYANIGKEARRISFRDIDVEQIGYIYEGLLGYTCKTVTDEVVIGLDGKDGEEPEIDAGTLQELYDNSTDGKDFAKALRDWAKVDQPSAKPATVAKIAKAYDAELTDEQRAEVTRQLTPIVGVGGRAAREERAGVSRPDNPDVGRVAGEDRAGVLRPSAADQDLLDFLVDFSPLIRRDLRGIPLVVPVGGLVVTETPSRKHAGAHYTPRSLAEEVVQHALEPLVYEPGPLQENDRDKWQLKGSTAILHLKVADIAAGSGAFLVAAARFLAERVVEAWTAEDAITTEERAQPDRAYERAIREVIARCLYGADINPMAVEMCKLSLWLVSLDSSKPFSFVDDRIFCGNSLLGVTDLDQLRYLHIYPDPKRMDRQLFVDVEEKLAEATRLRRELASPVVEHDPMRSRIGKERLLRQVNEVTAELRDIADGIVAAGLPQGGKPGGRLDDAYKALSWALSAAYPHEGSVGDRARLDPMLKRGLTPTVETDYERWKPTHWVVEAPDVMLDHGGFDAVIGNPPFLVSKKISGAIGVEVRNWLVEQVAAGRRGAGDFVVYFLLRAAALVRLNGGVFGLITSKVVAEGDSREVGLASLLASGATLFAAKRSEPWPASGPAAAAVRYSMLCGTFAEVTSPTVCLDGRSSSGISALLEIPRRASGTPCRLSENQGAMALGVYIHGPGFIVTDEQAEELVQADPKNREVLRQYLSGEDINSKPDSSASRWVIDFQDWSIDRASEYERPFDIVRRLVKPKRDTNNMKSRREYWWRYAVRAADIHDRIASTGSGLALTVVSKHGMPVRVPAGPLVTSAVALLPWPGSGAAAVLCSSVHGSWAWQWGSTMKTDLRYTPSDVFETFPRPVSTERLDSVGRSLDEERREIMLRRGHGLTKLYNLVNDPELQGDTDVDRMRELHVEIDVATMEAYGWDDLSLDHGFHTYRQMERWTVSPAARVEILDRLLELNHERARAEGQDVPDQGELF